MLRRRPQGRIQTTVITENAAALNLGDIGVELEDHRDYHQHQLMVYADGSSAGSWAVKIIPDSNEDNIVARADTGFTLDLNSANSGIVIFPAALKGLVLEEITPGTTGRNLTFIISSVKGPLIAA